MKEKIIIISIILSIILVTGVLAIGFSPGNLVFNLEPNQEGCQIITLSSDSETIAVSDKWAENKDVEWKVSLFDKDASYHSISIDYDNELLIDEREIEVCLSGSKIGEYHGVLLLKEEQQGNSVIQMGIWLKVIISEEPPQPASNTGSSGAGSSGSGGGGGGGGVSSNTNNNQNQKTTTAQETEEQQGNVGITGAAINENSNTRNNKIIGVTLVVIGVLGLFLYGRRRLRWKKYY